MFDLTLITPTGDRPEAFALCERWMRAQRFADGREIVFGASSTDSATQRLSVSASRFSVQWLVIDDGPVPTPCAMGQEVVRREPDPRFDPPHTLALNLRKALPCVASDRVLIIEDDDYYGPTYLETMMRWLDVAPLVGEIGAKYYNVRLPGWFRHHGHSHASLCRTGFSREVFGMFSSVIADDHPSVDLRLWTAWKGARVGWVDDAGDARLCVGMKGMPGRAGATWRHAKGYERDAGLAVLKRWVGDDWRVYAELLPEIAREAENSGAVARDPRGWRVNELVAAQDPGAAFGAGAGALVVYTAVIGGYDELREPPAEPEGSKVRFVAFTDRELPPLSRWQRHPVAAKLLDGWRLNRWHKTGSASLFPAAGSTLYLDGSIELTRPASEFVRWMESHGEGDVYLFAHNYRDCVYAEAEECLRIHKGNPDQIRRQVTRYRELGHPFHAGLWQGGCILRRNTPRVAALDREWWGEIAAYSHRDQLSLPVVLRRHPDVRVVTLPARARDEWITLHHAHKVVERDLVPGGLNHVVFGQALTAAHAAGGAS
jgi:hypothetical protein